MPGKTVKIRATEGGEFDCYLAQPAGGDKVPAVVLACAVHGVDADIRQIADEFAGHGFIAAAPDLFWRTVPGPLGHDDKRTQERSQPRLEKIKTNERDMVDTLTYLRTLPGFNGRAATMGFCYGGPYAILGPKRLGYAAGISCHGSQMLDYIKELDGVTEPVCIIWGDQDHRAPPEVLDAYRSVPARMKSVEVHIFPGILHGYMMPGSPKAFDQNTREFSMKRAVAILDGLRGGGADLAQGVIVSAAASSDGGTNIVVRPPHGARRGRPLLRGQGRFVDDLDIPGALHVAFLRSPVAHGRLNGIDASAAKALPGVHAVLTFADLRPLLTSDRIPQALPSGAIRFHVDPYVLAKDEVTYAGEPVAMVVADSRRVAEDALALIALDLEGTAAVVDPVARLEPGAPKAGLDCPDNLVARQSIDYGDIDGAFAKAAHRDQGALSPAQGRRPFDRDARRRGAASIRRRDADDLRQHPGAASRQANPGGGARHRRKRIRVVAPDTGGGFGPKAAFHPEELALPAAALLLRRPLKWMEDRRENFVAAVGERDQDWDMEMAVDAKGRMLALRGRLCHDHGACTPYGVALAYNAGTNVVGPYVLPAYRLDINWCLTNFVPCAPTRGAGRPQGMYVMERLLDAVAEQLGIARDEVRRRNMIQPAQMPYATPIKQRDGSTMTYDSGDYPECQRRALTAGGWADFPARQSAARKLGRHLGLGLANYVEGTGRGPFESASLRVGASGKIVITTGRARRARASRPC
jgi:dienelactone hydrolase